MGVTVCQSAVQYTLSGNPNALRSICHPGKTWPPPTYGLLEFTFTGVQCRCCILLGTRRCVAAGLSHHARISRSQRLYMPDKHKSESNVSRLHWSPSDPHALRFSLQKSITDFVQTHFILNLYMRHRIMQGISRLSQEKDVPKSQAR